MTTSTLTRPTMELSEALRYARRNQVFFCYRYDGRVDVCSFGRKLSMPFKRGVYKNEAHILEMMRSHHPRVCPTYLHALEWVFYRDTGRYVCLMCARLAV